MKKVGVISISLNTLDLNHGAILHCWAFQQYLKKIGFDSEIINYASPGIYGRNLKYPFYTLFTEGKLKAAIVALFTFPVYARRYDKIQNFINKELKVTKDYYSKDQLSCMVFDYDCIFCESDIIWDANFFGGHFDSTFFLALPSMKNVRKIAYSPSVGNLDFNDGQKKEFLNLISNLDFISCREQYATDFVNNYCNRYASWVVDPVLLLNQNDYERIEGKRLIREPYLLLYTPVGYDILLIQKAKAYAKSKKLKLIEISRYAWNNVSHKTIVDAGIEDFLSLIKYSEAIFTNSFHGICFSIIYKKNFYAFPRKTGRKIEDICKRFGILNRFSTVRSFKELPDIDYREVYEKLEEARHISNDFIAGSLY